MKKLILISGIILLLSNLVQAQDKMRSWTLNGYLSSLNNVSIPPNGANWNTMTTMTNRLDFKWYPCDVFSFHVGGRNIFNYGQIVEMGYIQHLDLFLSAINKY